MANQLLAQLSAARVFLQEWVQRPSQIGAIFPSSRHLSLAMADWLPADSDEYVLELGPGTGSVTEALLNRGLRHDRLIAVEKSPRLAGLLRDRFPRARFITGDALNLDKLVRKQFRHVETVGAVISSLPLRNFKPEDADALAIKIHDILRPGGTWVQYSYYLGQERAKATAAFHLRDTHIIWRNVPPARLSAYQR